MQRIRFLADYSIYFLTAQTEYNIHSPFVYDFYTKVVRNKYPYKEYKQINTIKALLLNSSEISIDVNKWKTHNSAKTGKLLFRIARYFKPQNMYQWGTSLGINAHYLALGNKNGTLTTFEPNTQIASQAQQGFDIGKTNNIYCIIGNTSDFFSLLSKEDTTIDLLLFSQFNYEAICQSILFAQPQSIFIIENIHHSKENYQHWKSIQAQPQVNVSIDLFSVGILFFKKELSTQSFVLRV